MEPNATYTANAVRAIAHKAAKDATEFAIQGHPLYSATGLQPPTEIEEAVLGGLILQQTNDTHRAFSLLSEASFHTEKYATLFKVVKNMHISRQPIDLVTINEELKKLPVARHEAFTPTIADVIDVTNHVICSVNIIFHCKLLIQHQIQRGMITAHYEYAKRLFDKQDIFDSNDWLQQEQDRVKLAANIEPPANLAIGYEDRLLRKLYGDVKQLSLTGLPTLDKVLGISEGDGNLIIVTGETGSGKSAFQNTVAIRCFEADTKCFSVSSETNGAALLAKMIAGSSALQRAQITDTRGFFANFTSIKRGVRADGSRYFDDRAAKKIHDIAKDLRKGAVVQVNLNGLTIDKYLDACLSEYNNGARVFLFDRLELFTGGKDWSEIDDRCNRLRAFSVEYGCVFIVFAQLSRSDASKMSKRLRGSAGIEQAAMIVVGIQRDAETNTITFNIDKNSEGETGAFEGFTFDYNRQIFTECEPFEDEPF